MRVLLLLLPLLLRLLFAPAMIGTAFERAPHPDPERMVARLERQHHDRDTAISSTSVVGLGRIEDAAVRRIEAGLGDGTDRACGFKQARKAHRGASAEFRARLQAHPGARDHAQNALRADEEPVGTWPRPRSGQPSRLNHAARRNDPQAFDEIIDMGIETCEMAAGSRRDPAAKRRIFKALRKMPQAETMHLELGLK